MCCCRWLCLKQALLQAAKYAAGAALSVLLVTALAGESTSACSVAHSKQGRQLTVQAFCMAGVEWLPFSGPRQTLQDLYHHHMLEQQDVTDFRSQPEPSMQDMAGGLIKRAKNWTPSLRILQGIRRIRALACVPDNCCFYTSKPSGRGKWKLV